MKVSEPVIVAEAVRFVYPSGREALSGVDIVINSNEFVAIVGQNGAGKTTLLKTFLGLLKPTSGRVLVKGVDTREASVSEMATRVGLVLQNPDHQLFAQTVLEEVSFGPVNLGLAAEEVHERARAALEQVGMWHLRDAYPPSLSKGDRAKVVIASVLAMRPEIIILDEPTTGQDYLGCCQIMQIAQQLHGQGHTIVMVTHNMALVCEYAHRTIVMAQGRVLMDGPTAEVFSYPEVLATTYIEPPQITRLAQDLPAGIRPARLPLTVPQFGDWLLDLAGQRGR